MLNNCSSIPSELIIADALSMYSQLDSESARLDVEYLLCHVLECESVYLRTWPERELSSKQITAFFALFNRRQSGEPVAHICGKRAFWTLDLNVSPATLIPRPDTELLVETILQLPLAAQAKILDLGTGTGAIALALASERPQWEISASDFLPEIVQLARQNAVRHQLDHVNIFQSNWFENIRTEHYDLIVSNPPYIDPEDEHLAQGDVRFEPRSALVAADKGLADLAHIIRGAQGFLKPKAWLVLEHGYDQALSVQQLFKSHGYFNITSVKDYGNHNRLTMAQVFGQGTDG